MTGMMHGKMMHLINESDFQLLQSMKQENVSTTTTTKSNESLQDSDEVVMKKHHEKIMRDEKEENFRENVEWKKIGDKLSSIIHPDSTVKTDMVDDIVSFLPDSYKNKGKLFLQRLSLEDRVHFDKKLLYIDGQPLSESILDVVDYVVKPRKKIPSNLERLVTFLDEVRFPKALIVNTNLLPSLISKSKPSNIATSTPNTKNIRQLQSNSLSSIKSKRQKRGKKDRKDEEEEEEEERTTRDQLDDSLQGRFTGKTYRDPSQNGTGSTFKWFSF